MKPAALKCNLVALIGLLSFGGSLLAATSVARHGVTWTFSADSQVGQYANGDWWVVGPITLVSISPEPKGGRNGWGLNPSLGVVQSFDDRIPYHQYKPSPVLPQLVPVDTSVVSSVSTVENMSFGQIASLVILTVVAEPPAKNSFRPPYIGAGKKTSEWTTGNLDYSKLARVPRSELVSMPPLAVTAAAFERVWYEQNLNWSGRYLHPASMTRTGYGREMAVLTGNAGLTLNSDLPNGEKEELLIRFIQYGIDIFGILRNGGVWYADGGHNIGRLAPALIAAAMLNDDGMKSMLNGAAGKFQEFQQTFYVTRVDVSTSRLTSDGKLRQPYQESHIGMPEWGIIHSADRSKDDAAWSAAYRDIVGGQLTAPSLIAHVMKAEGILAWPALSDYAKRHLSYETGPEYKGEFRSNPTLDFHKEFHRACYLNRHQTPSQPTRLRVVP